MGTFGPAYEAVHDAARLTKQSDVVRDVMLRASAEGKWLTLTEIEKLTHYPQASISAQLRHLRKPVFGSYVVEKRSRGERLVGLYEYRVTPPEHEVSSLETH